MVRRSNASSTNQKTSRCRKTVLVDLSSLASRIMPLAAAAQHPGSVIDAARRRRNSRIRADEFTSKTAGPLVFCLDRDQI
jgi:hypothetical protein